MLHSPCPLQKRKDFRKKLKSGKLLKLPGSFSPLVSRIIEKQGFDGVYISGGVLSTDLGYPDIGLTTATEVLNRAEAINRTTQLPTLLDIDTGFGEAINVARTICQLEEKGISACHLEDQTLPKRCGHLDEKKLISTQEMVEKISWAVKARRDNNFVIAARTDALANEGLDKAIERAKAYQDAGADIIFPEALKEKKDFEAFRSALSVPLLANMTEFGKSPLLTATELEDLGYNLVIYPVTSWRLAMKAVEDGLATIQKEGTQASVVEKMQTRQELYDLVEYESYSKWDQSIFNFWKK